MTSAVAGLSVAGICLKPEAPPFDDFFAAGEIIGLAGLDGHGQETFLEALAGLRSFARGEARIVKPAGSQPIAGFRRAARQGIVYLPRDRCGAGIFPNLSVLDNFAIFSIGRDIRGLLIHMGARRRRFEAFRERLSIKLADPAAPITRLSGGNQQKVLLARLLASDPAALLLNDPTRGVDVATRRAFYEVFRELARARMTIVILSSELHELTALCDRVLVFREQAVAARLSAADLTSERIISAMFGEAA